MVLKFLSIVYRIFKRNYGLMWPLMEMVVGNGRGTEAKTRRGIILTGVYGSKIKKAMHILDRYIA
jgi:hypothetical protein